MYAQMNKYIFFLNTRFRKGYRAKQNLLTLIEKVRVSLDQNGTESNLTAFLTDLSRAFDCIPHDLLIFKLHC